MLVPKKYFHDRLIILLLAIDLFLTTVGVLLVLFRLDFNRSTGYIIEFRANYGVGEYKTGGAISLSSFIFLMLMNLTVGFLLSARTFRLRRHIALTCLGLTGMLALLAIVVSNALLVLR